jgi:uncharacterized membrane protein YjjB (DUF3815 family)
MTTNSLFLTLVQDAFWSGVAAVGFAILFNAPRRTLPGCMICGALGHVLRTILMQNAGFSIEAATLAGATVVGFVGSFFARQWHTPAAIFTVSGAIPLVPGVFAYRTMIGLLQIAAADPTTGETVLIQTSINAIKTALILASIAGGIAAPALIFERRRPVV